MSRSQIITLAEEKVYGFKDFLKSLRTQFIEPAFAGEEEIERYLRETKLWHNQFMYIHHIKNGRFYHKGFDQALDYDLKQLTTDFLVRCIHPADLQAYLNISRALLSFVMDNSTHLIPFTSSFNINYRVRKKDGSYISILRQNTPFLKDRYNKVEAYISLCTDISDITDDNKVKWHIYGPKSELFPTYLKKQQRQFEEDRLFSDREIDVLKLVASGLTTGQIAERLFISTNTVNTHRKNMMRKANVNKTIDLIAYGKENQYL